MIRLPPASAPAGWWLDHDPVLLFHGTDSNHLPSITEQGLLPGTDRLFLTPDFQTAANYSLFGPDGGDIHCISGLRCGLPAVKVYPVHRYCVVHVAVPRAFVEEHGEYRPETAGSWFTDLGRRKRRLADRSHYDQSDEADSRYYRWTEVYFVQAIPAEYITGYSLPYIRQ